MYSALYFLVLLILLVGYGLFLMLSLALARASASELERSEEQGVWGAKLANQLIEDSDKHILSAYAGRLICAFTAGVCALLVYQPLVATCYDSFPAIPWFIIGGFLGLTLLLVVCSIALFLGQVANILAVAAPEFILLNFGWFCSFFTRVVFPIRVLVRALTLVFQKFGLLQTLPSERDLTFSAEDLEHVIEHSTQAGTLDNSESELLQGALRLAELKVREIMTPRADIVSVTEEASIESLQELIGDVGLSRILITGEQLDDVKGMILAKDLIPLIGRQMYSTKISDLIRDVLFVEGDLEGDEVLKRLRASQGHLAVVLDEHGGVDGIVTLEDLLEEVVGDIFDETDIPQDDQDIAVTVAGDLIVGGGISLSDLESEFGLELPEGEYDTIAGFIINQMGRIPEVGETLEFEESLIKIEEVDENRVTKLKITLSQEAA